MAGIMRGMAWLIPYCARHHPSHLKDNGCRGSACSPVSGQEGRRPQTARVITRCNLKSNGYPAHHPPHFSGGAGGWAGLHCARPPSTPSASARNESILSARCASTTGSPAAPPLFPVCATREHVRPPALRAPLVTCAMREHGGLAWPPRSFHPSSPDPSPFVTRGHLPSLAQQSHAVASCLSPENKHGDPNGIRRRASYLPGALSRQPDLALPVP